MPLSSKRRAQLMGGSYIRLLAEHEVTIADFYDTLANLLKSSEAFWRILSKEELGHERMIMKIDEKFREGEWRFKRPDFVISSIADSLEWIAARKYRVVNDGISMREALKAALEIETGMLEHGFFKIVDNDTPAMMEVMETQVAYTRAHIKRIQLEAKRLKWKIIGGRKILSKKILSKDPAQQLSREMLKANIKAAQADMLGLLISMEEATSRLYNAYSERLGDTSKFWAKMGVDETQHGSMLRQLYKILENGKLFNNIDHFNKKALEEMIEFILNAEFDALHGKLSLYQAVCTAYKIERSMIESGFYSTVTSDAIEFQIIARRLVDLTKEHTGKIEAEMLRVTRLGDSAKKNLPPAGQRVNGAS